MFLVGIAGGSGSGKTTFGEKVIHRLKSPVVTVLHQDSYYQVFPQTNFDHPDAFDWELLRDHLGKLKAGERVDVPVYDFKQNQRTSRVTPIGPCRAMLMEGIFALWDPVIRDLFDVKIFLHVDADIRFIRRLHRDVKERGRSIDSIIRQYV